MTISYETLYTDVWSTIKNTIVASAPYISDTVTVGTTVTVTNTPASIEASWNDKLLGKPIVVINPMQKEEQKTMFGQSSGRMMINVVVDCYGKKSIHADQLAQQTDFAVSNQSIIEMELVGVTNNSAFEQMLGQNKSFAQSITFTFIKDD